MYIYISLDCIDIAGCSSARGRQTKVGTWGEENGLFSTFMRQYLENVKRHVENYYEWLWLIGSCICGFDCHQYRWPWMILNCY